MVAISSCHSPKVKYMQTPMSEVLRKWNNPIACGIQLYFLVHCLAITVEHLVVSLLYMSYTAVMSYSYY